MSATYLVVETSPNGMWRVITRGLTYAQARDATLGAPGRVVVRDDPGERA